MNDKATRMAQNRGPVLNEGGSESDDSDNTVVGGDFIVLSIVANLEVNAIGLTRNLKQ